MRPTLKPFGRTRRSPEILMRKKSRVIPVFKDDEQSDDEEEKLRLHLDQRGDLL